MIIMMDAVMYSEAGGLRVERVALPTTGAGEALIKISRAGICSTDIQILRGYVPGFDYILGHEFVGIVDDCPRDRLLEGKRVVGEINCRCGEPCSHPDPVFVRNHAPSRKVLGIIGKDGTLAEYCTLPVDNLHVVPQELTDQEACFAEPLAAAFRILEQQVIRDGDSVAVVGDGKLGLLVAQLLVLRGNEVTHIGRHERKMALVEGTRRVLATASTAAELGSTFDAAVEASGSSQGISLAMALTRPLGTVVLKSTCSAVGDPLAPMWPAIANDAIVNEKTLVGSRCGPFSPALEALKDERMRRLVNAMVEAVVPLAEGVAAMGRAQRKGALKVQLTTSA